MGVKHLWTILEAACQQGSSDDLAGKSAAVDLSIWIMEARSIATNHQRNSLHLRTLFFRVLNMIYLNIKPIFVLDSTKISELKLDTVAKRLATKNSSINVHRSNFNRLIEECSKLLTYLGLPIIRADGEAEKLCAHLNQMNIVDVVITNDSDCFVYGAKKIIRNFGIDMKSITFDIYDEDEIQSTCHLNQRSLLVLALLLGSDYDRQGLQGIGKEHALKFLQSLPEQVDPLEYLRTLLKRSCPENKSQQRIYNLLKENPETFQHFEKIIDEYSSKPAENLSQIASIASIKWLKPVQLKDLQKYMLKKLGWIESYTFVKVFPLLTRFQILYRLNMLELDVNDVLSLSNTKIFEPIGIKRIRLRQSKQYYEVEWKQHQLPSSETLEDQLNHLSLIVIDDEDDEEEEKLITIEPADLFRHAYPEVVHRFEVPRSKLKKTKGITQAKKKSQAASTSMSLDLLSMMQDQTLDSLPPPTKKFNHRPTMAALSTSMNIDVLSVIDKSNANFQALKKAKSRPINQRTQSDMVIHTDKPVILLNTSISLDVLDIVLRDQSKPSTMQRRKLATQADLIDLTSSDINDEQENVLPLPLWDRIRQRPVVQSVPN